MTDRPAAGWYDDPLQPNSRRYWDGSSWTDDAHPKADVAAPPPPPAPAAPAATPGRQPFMTRGGVDIAMIFALVVWPVGFILGLWLLGGEDRQRAWKVIAISVIVPVVYLVYRIGGGT